MGTVVERLRARFGQESVETLAAESAIGVLREGGNAIEAMVAAAASIAVVYPHMNSIGGDGFWLIHIPGESPRAIDAIRRWSKSTQMSPYWNGPR